MKIRKWFIGVGAMLLVVGLSLPTSLAYASEVTVTLDAPTEVTAGSEFVARLTISHVEDFDAAVVRVRFDPTILSLPTEDANRDNIYDSITDGNIGGTTIPIAATIEKEPGLVGITANVPGFPGVTGEGYLVEFHFYVLTSGVSEISLEHHSMSNKDAQLISSAWVDNMGNVTVSPIPSPPVAVADMGVSNLVVHPSQMEPNEKISIEVDVFNNGPAEGSYEVVLMINGAKETIKEVTLAGGESTTVTFISSRLAEGSYLANVNGLTKEFIVGTTIPSGSPSSSESPVEEGNYSPGEIRGQSEETTAGAVPPSDSPAEVNWPVLGGITGGVIVVTVVSFIWLLRRRAY